MNKAEIRKSIEEQFILHHDNCPRTLNAHKDTDGEDGRQYTSLSEVADVLYDVYEKTLWGEAFNVDDENAVALGIEIIRIMERHLAV